MMTIFVVAMAFGLLAALDQKHKPVANKTLASLHLLCNMAAGGAIGLIVSLFVADAVPTTIAQEMVILHPLDAPGIGADKALLLKGRNAEIHRFTVRYEKDGKLVYEALDPSLAEIEIVKNLGPDIMIKSIMVPDKQSWLFVWATIVGRTDKVVKYQINVHIDHIEDAVR